MNVIEQQSCLGKILVADNKPDALEQLQPGLANAGYIVIKAETGGEALEKVRQEKPDLVILELNLPGMSGFDVCKALKSNTATCEIPLVILTSMTTEIDRIVALEIGADDYMTKPFSVRELVLRIRAVLRRSHMKDPVPGVKQVGSLVLDAGRYSVQLKGKHLHLTPIEFKLLEALIDSLGHLLSREALLKNVWSGDGEITARTVDTHIQRLREKLGVAGQWIETVRGKGYKIIEPTR